MQHESDIDLKEFISLCKTRLNRIFDRLEWSEESTLRDFNTNSLASPLKSSKILKKSCLNGNTYPDSCSNNNSIVLETPKLQEILQNSEVRAPNNFKELQANFTREEKLKIYEHVIENTEKLENNAIDKEIEGEIPLADILAQKKREEKRKKRRFRKSKPTHVEEVRCLVELQMQALQQFLGNRMNKKREETSENCTLKAEEDKTLLNTKYSQDDYRKKRDREKRKDHHGKNDDYKRRSRSKEYVYQKHKKQKRSSSRERKRRTRSRSKERSSNKGIRSKQTKRRSRTRSEDRRKYKEIYSYKRSSRSKSKEKKYKYYESESDNKNFVNNDRKYGSSRREKSDYYLKYSHGRESRSDCNHYTEKFSNKECYRKESETEGNVNSNKSKRSHSSKSEKASTSHKDYKIVYPTEKRSFSSKSPKHSRRH